MVTERVKVKALSLDICVSDFIGTFLKANFLKLILETKLTKHINLISPMKFIDAM